MSGNPLISKSSETLVKDYLRIGLLMYDANEDDDIDEFNNLIEDSWKIERQLKSRSGDHRHLLVPLLEHENPQLRLNTINATLVVEPIAARRALDDLAASNYVPYNFEARSTVGDLDSGFWVPD